MPCRPYIVTEALVQPRPRALDVVVAPVVEAEAAALVPGVREIADRVLEPAVHYADLPLALALRFVFGPARAAGETRGNGPELSVRP